jgi:hypothetical protein
MAISNIKIQEYKQGGSVKEHLDKADSHLREVGTKLHENKNPREKEFREKKEALDEIFTIREQSELGYAKGGYVSPSERVMFENYMYDFYGKDKGIYAGDYDGGFSKEEISIAVDKYIQNPETNWGGGDSVDRELARDKFLIPSKYPTLEKGGEIDYNEIKRDILEEKGYTESDFHKGMIDSSEAREIMKLANERYAKLSKANAKDLGMRAYAKGGSVEFTDLTDNTQPYHTWEGKTSTNNKQQSVGAFSHNINGRYVGDYYLYMLNDWDEEYYGHLPLKQGEILMRIETDRMVGGEMPLIKINVDKGWVYFMSDENNLNSDEDDKNPKFNTRTADVNYLSLDKNIQKSVKGYAKGGEVKDKYAVGIRLFTEDEDDDSTGYGYIHIYANSPEEALSEAERLSESDEYINIMEDTTMPSWDGWDEEYSWEINADDDENPYLQPKENYAKGGELKGKKVISFYYDVYNNPERFVNGREPNFSRLSGDYKKAFELAMDKVKQDKKDGTYEFYRGNTPSKLSYSKGGDIKLNKYELYGTVVVIHSNKTKEVMGVEYDVIYATSKNEAIKKWKQTYLSNNVVESIYVDDLEAMSFEYEKGGEITKDKWKSIVSKFLNEFYGNYEEDTWEDYIDSDSVESTQTKSKSGGYNWDGRPSKYGREVSFKEAYETFKSSLTPKELKSIKVSFDDGEYADAEEHDRDKSWSSITIHKVGSYAKGGAMDDLGNPTDKKVIEEMEVFIENEIPKLNKKVYFTDGMLRKQAKSRFYKKYEYGAYNPKFSFEFEKGGSVDRKEFDELFEMFPDNWQGATDIWKTYSADKKEDFRRDLGGQDAASEGLVEYWNYFVKAKSEQDMWDNYPDNGDYAKGGTLYEKGGENISFYKDDKYWADYSDIGQFSISRSNWSMFTEEDFYEKGKNIVKKEYNGDIEKAYDTIVREKRSFAKGGETESPITNYHKNIMGTLSFDLKVKGMRKPQDFIVYPITEKTDKIRIQSDKKFGEIHISSGRGVLSKSGNTSWHLALDIMNRNVNTFQLNDAEMEELKSQIRATTGKDVGSSFVTTDNSGAELLAKGGSIDMSEIEIYKSSDEDYTVVMNGDVYGMNSHNMPNMSVDLYDGVRSEYPSDISHWGRKINFEDAPIVIKDKIERRKAEFIKEVESQEMYINAELREDIEVLEKMVSEEQDNDIKSELIIELNKLKN